MEVLIEDIPEEGLDVSSDERSDWFAGVVREALGDSFGEGEGASLSVKIFKIEGNINLDGKVDLTARRVCGRCLKTYKEDVTIPFHTVLSPLYENKRQREVEKFAEAELVKEDLEFSYYDGDRFDLDEIVREQIILAEPMKHLCRKDCLGLCQRCGKDLNEGACGCREDRADPRWAVLKGVKLRKKQ